MIESQGVDDPNAVAFAHARSRPSFAHIPSAVIGTSPGAIGTAVGQQHQRSILGFLNSPQMNSPEGHIQFKDGFLNEAGEVADSGTAKYLANYMEEFHQHIARVLAVLPRGA